MDLHPYWLPCDPIDGPLVFINIQRLDKHYDHYDLVPPASIGDEQFLCVDDWQYPTSYQITEGRKVVQQGKCRAIGRSAEGLINLW